MVRGLHAESSGSATTAEHFLVFSAVLAHLRASKSQPVPQLVAMSLTGATCCF